MQTFWEETMVTGNWREIQKAAEEDVPVLFPLGVIEEHGPHLPVGCDIYWSTYMCRRVKEKLKEQGQKSVIAPPYYWGVNHCTGGCPGSFSLKPETMKQVLFEIFENLKSFGFSKVFCFSYHGDARHVRVIVDAIKRANAELHMQVKLVLEGMDLELYKWQGKEDFLLVSNPAYPIEWFEEQEPSEQGLLDIHAGAFETAVMNHICPEEVDLDTAMQLKSSSLNGEGMKKWLAGVEQTKEVVSRPKK